MKIDLFVIQKNLLYFATFGFESHWIAMESKWFRNGRLERDFVGES